MEDDPITPADRWQQLKTCITMTSKWARWSHKTPVSRLFTQAFIQAQIKEKHRSSASMAFVTGIHRWPVSSPRKEPATQKMFPFDDVIMRKVYLYTLFNYKSMHSFIEHICTKNNGFYCNCSKLMSDMYCIFVYQILYRWCHKPNS